MENEMLIHNLHEVIRNASREANIRTLIILDKTSQRGAYGQHDLPYENTLNLGMITKSFDETLNTLQKMTIPRIDISTIPILKFIGLMKVTVITRYPANVVTVTDGENNPIDMYLGIG